MQIAAGCARRGEQDKANTIKQLVDAAQIEDEYDHVSFPGWGALPPSSWMFTSTWQAVKFFTVVARNEQGLDDPWDLF